MLPLPAVVAGMLAAQGAGEVISLLNHLCIDAKSVYDRSCSMTKVRVLFGKKIVPHHMLNYAEQIYDIMVAEIELGRWKVNDRLPGVMALAKELQFGTKTIQSSYDRLKQEGYVTSLGYRGTYLNSQYPQAPAKNGKIGVLVSEKQTGQPLILWYEHVILQWARRRNLLTEVKVLPGDLNVREANQKGVIFEEDVLGIISLTPFRMPVRFGDSAGSLPLVFLCPPFEPCAPKVCADVRDAYYDPTSRLIRYGHTRVVFSEDSVEPDPEQTKMHREGYLEAMKEHGLPVDMPLLKSSREVRNTELTSVSGHLKEIMRPRLSERPTAVVAGSLGRGMALTRVAPLHKIEIPRNLSLATIGSDRLEGQGCRQITGMLPDFDHMVEMCFAVLDQQKQSWKSNFTKIHVRMHFLPGDTVRSLTTPVESNGSEPSAAATKHDIQTLSQAVPW